MTALVTLRNTVSKQTAEYTQEDADRILAHPVFGKVNKVVRTAKPEVLAPEYTLPERSDETENKATEDNTEKEAE